MKATWYSECLDPGLVDLHLGDSAGDAEVRSENISSSVKDAVMAAVFMCFFFFVYVTVPPFMYWQSIVCVCVCFMFYSRQNHK